MSIDWSTAQVSDGKLTVGLKGDCPRGWKDRFKRTARLLGKGDWDEVRLKKEEIRVGGVVPGTEDKLRHLLESIVEEANAVNADASAPSEDASPEVTEDDDDSRMTQQFRSYAQADGAPTGT